MPAAISERYGTLPEATTPDNYDGMSLIENTHGSYLIRRGKRRYWITRYASRHCPAPACPGQLYFTVSTLCTDQRAILTVGNASWKSCTPASVTLVPARLRFLSPVSPFSCANPLSVTRVSLK
jgi:hypothetical protein